MAESQVNGLTRDTHYHRSLMDSTLPGAGSIFTLRCGTLAVHLSIGGCFGADGLNLRLSDYLDADAACVFD